LQFAPVSAIKFSCIIETAGLLVSKAAAQPDSILIFRVIRIIRPSALKGLRILKGIIRVLIFSLCAV